MRFFIFVACFFSISICLSQKIGVPAMLNSAVEAPLTHSHFEKQQIQIHNSRMAEQFLLSQLGLGSGEMKLSDSIESLTGMHYTFFQSYLGIPIYHSQGKINCDVNGNVISWFERIFSRQIKNEQFPDTMTLISLRESYFQSRVQLSGHKIWYPQAEGLVACYQFISHDPISSSSFETIVNAQGEMLIQRDLNRYHVSPKDTVVQALVFNPDPLSTVGKSYGGNYKDNNDTDPSGKINAERQMVHITVTLDNDTFRLKSPYAMAKNLSGPDDTIAYSLTPSFNFERSHLFFEDVNAFYHINQFHAYMSGIGFKNLVNYPIEMDTHALMGDDNSMFVSSTSPPQLLFGQGGVDDAEDADVVIHEYGHAISFSASPNTLFGNERDALDEGCGDYFAASYSRSIKAFHWDHIFTWDGHNEFWAGRTAITSKKYPLGLVGEAHGDGEIWASALMSIWDKIGRKNTDKLVLESMYSYAGDMRMCDAARLILQMDSMMNHYANYANIYTSLDAYGLWSCFTQNTSMDEKIEDRSDFKICNSDGFRQGLSPLSFQLKNEILHPQNTLTIFDVMGGLKAKFYNVDCHDFYLYPDAFERGIYMGKWTDSKGNYFFKMIKN